MTINHDQSGCENVLCAHGSLVNITLDQTSSEASISMQHFAEDSSIHSIFHVLNDNSTLVIDFFSIVQWTKSCNLEATNANAPTFPSQNGERYPKVRNYYIQLFLQESKVSIT